MDKETAISAAIEYGTEHGFARGTTKYKLKDWGFSRQMYWGEPIPMVYCEKCGWQPINESELPLLQPHMDDYKPTDTGESPLARATEWIKTTCPCCGGAAKRETDTMPQWAGSSWYFMRYLDPRNDKEFCRRSQLDKWMPVDHYNGGMEHTTRHLLYSRFWYKALADLGYVPGAEPYQKRTCNGLIMGPDGQKMSKSRGNVVPSSDVVARTGADACRLAILYLAPWEQNNMNWSEDTLRGVERFLRRVESAFDGIIDDAPTADQDVLINRLVADVTERLDGMKFNTAISAMMEFLNAFPGGKMPRRAYEILIQMLNPFAPHLTEEMWEKLGHADMLVFEPWPTFDASKLVQTTTTFAVTVNGKRVGEFNASVDATDDDLIVMAKNTATRQLTGAEIIKTIVVPKKLVNFVVKK